MTRLRHAIMGSRHILAAATAFALFPAAASAQDAAPTQPPPPGSLQGFQLDPSRDTSKPRPPEQEGPEIDNRPRAPLPTPAPAPVVVAPPPVIRTVTPTPAPSPTPQRPVRAQDSQPPASQPREATPAAATPPPVQAPAAQTEAPATSTATEPSVPAIPAPADNAATSPPAAADTPSRSNLPWIIAAIAIAGIAGLALFLRRRKRPEEEFAEQEVAEKSDAVEEGDPATPAAPQEPEEPAPAPAHRPNAALSVEFVPLGARHTLIGAAVGYRIILHNTGEVAAENVAIATMIANADARQEQELAGFFARPVHAGSHSADRIEPGFSVEFTGELRLAADAIVPIKVRDRALLIPLVAFSAHYGWDGGNGYSGAAFIVGEESDPPRERMAPFRIDQGPRQYRSVGSRPARTALVG